MAVAWVFAQLSQMPARRLPELFSNRHGLVERGGAFSPPSQVCTPYTAESASEQTTSIFQTRNSVTSVAAGVGDGRPSGLRVCAALQDI